MNKNEKDIINYIFCNGFTNQRDLSNTLKVSLGLINKNINNLIHTNFLTEDLQITEKARKIINKGKVKSAIILAAGSGMRSAPISEHVPKALLEVKEEILIERIINQLHEKQIQNIIIVVGFMKEKFEYLIDKYNVKLIVNPKFCERNNLYSLFLAKDFIDNSYVIPCDIYSKNNLFNDYELYSWYMVTDSMDTKSTIRVNKNLQLVNTTKSEEGNRMIGIAFISTEDSHDFKKELEILVKDISYNNSFWEELICNKRLSFKPMIVDNNAIVEINTFEDLIKFDSNSKSILTPSIQTIKEVFGVKVSDIKNLQILKKGMTNKSFTFEIDNVKYIMRIPGEGTYNLINRYNEAEVYNTIKTLKISDDIIYINPNNGYKITKYIDNSRVCDPYNQDDLKICMSKLKMLHELNLKVSHKFDLFKNIDYYESLWKEKSIYDDYNITKKHVLELQKYIEGIDKSFCLTHIDAVPDNFLISNKEARLIDWEYSGMQDPHVDIAMFCIYAMYDKEHIDNLINIYFNNKCSKKTRIKIYAYIAICGLLWSNWCEYKRQLGVEFGEYSLYQYRYAKEYYKIVINEIGVDKIE